MANIFWGIIHSILVVWGVVWWIVLPIIALLILWEAWKLHLHYKFVTSIRWKMLEIKVPKNVLKTPKAMEQIFAAAHAPYFYGIPWIRKYWYGQEEYWMIFELIGKAGETHFYLRLPSDYRNMMESAIYAAYPEAEITEADDYLNEMPHVLPSDTYDAGGFEEVLLHENYLPIRTYLAFEDPTEERRIDTVAPIMEAMSKLKDDEQLWFQLLIKPTGEAFRKEGEEEIKKLMGIEEKKKASMWPKFDLGITPSEALRGPFQHPGEASEYKENKQEKFPRFLMTPVDKERAEAIHLKISKIAFEATLRFVFIEKKGASAKDVGHTNSIHGFIRQFNTQNLNSLKPYSPTSTASYTVKGLFKKTRLRARKHLLYENYRHLSPSHHESILNIEELASVFHFPLAVVSTTELEKVESRKGSPPAALPIIEE
ncbi:MAG TPA: hypothetical protein VIJ29_00275 [Candidatus Paceibacterota bacterium]